MQQEVAILHKLFPGRRKHHISHYIVKERIMNVSATDYMEDDKDNYEELLQIKSLWNVHIRS